MQFSKYFMLFAAFGATNVWAAALIASNPSLQQGFCRGLGENCTHNELCCGYYCDLVSRVWIHTNVICHSTLIYPYSAALKGRSSLRRHLEPVEHKHQW